MLNPEMMAKINAQVDSSLPNSEKTTTKVVEKNESKNEKEIVRNEPIKKGGSKVQISLIVPSENKNKWKSFFDDRGITFTNGISMALDYFIKAVEKGNVEIDYFGIKN